MAKALNETRPARLRAALIASGEESRALIAELRGSGEFELVAYSARTRRDDLPDLEWVDDRRVLLARGGYDVLFLDASTRTGEELGWIALERGLHVWRRPPLARSFAAGVDLARRALEAPTAFHVLSEWDACEQGVRAAFESARLGAPLYSELLVRGRGPAHGSWQASQEDAGGGALARSAYAACESLIALRGLPERVYAATGRLRRGADEPRETEDVAVVVLSFAAGGLALLRAGWDIGGEEEVTVHHGPTGTLTMKAPALVSTNVRGRRRARVALQPRSLAEQLAAFAAEIRTPLDPPQRRTRLNRHLAVSAVLDAAYLSARTGQPEQPRRSYALHKWPEPEA